jgi:hypothetical protein
MPGWQRSLRGALPAPTVCTDEFARTAHEHFVLSPTITAAYTGTVAW